jgi:predicted TIM-barrel fold metal-dependent hydrolase
LPRIIDCHVHHLADSDVDWARELGYQKVCLIDWKVDVLQEAMRKHPDFVVGVGWMPLDADADAAKMVAAIERFRQIGCMGLKACCAAARYDDERFYPAYAKAEQLGMPIFFHTGWLDQRVAGSVYPIRTRLLAEWYHPYTLDRITLDFPRLRMVAYHMGVTWVAEAAALMRNHPNIYGDSCHHFEPSLFWPQIGGDTGGMQVMAKMVYGTDGMGTRQFHQDGIASFVAMLNTLGVPPGLQDRILYRNALHVLGLDEQLKKTFRILPPAAAGAPAMDLSRPAPAGLAAMTDFTALDAHRVGEPARSATTCWMAYDQAALHVMARCAEATPASLALGVENGPIENLWMDDSIELFLSPGRDDQYAHILINAAGRSAVQKGRGEIVELPGRSESRVGPDGWAIRLSLPWALLGPRPAAGDTWGLNVCRNKRTDPRETITWSEVATTFHDPDSFGKLLFG